jgi:hypothetical protein
MFIFAEVASEGGNAAIKACLLDLNDLVAESTAVVAEPVTTPLPLFHF